MSKRKNMYKEIPLELLTPNTKRPNRMSRMFSKKLRSHIKRVGRYETLTVRPHPTRKGCFEVLNGHARLDALRDLGLQTAKCDVWEMDDLESRLFLATLNRVQCSEAPELRMRLLLELLKAIPKEDIAKYVPETLNSLEQLEQLEMTLTDASRE